MKETIRISEIFGPTVQGEGPLIGRPAVFVRTGGCDYRCAWCDTLYAVLPEYRSEWTPMTPEQIVARIDDLTAGHPIPVTLTGGNPATQPLEPLIELGRARGHGFAVETQGSVAAPWFAALDWLILSPKPPSSGMTTDWDALDACLGAAGQGPRVVLKVVVFDDADFAYAKDLSSRHPTLPVYLQVGNPAPLIAADGRQSEDADMDDLGARLRWLIGRVTDDRWFSATVLPQLHVLAWGNRRGV
ncbi:7-carboxy-7-deazaguanine synthase QueE [Rhodoplanes sp. Z2-YC6860]|uniref:7-carboxy-7-deazaguanine synthase QueE n=1 Tax=Rhodoplanes sp. Z2-YC6860 TaxID=674703 RepID=UPI00078C9F57|nr:7-carboxy-7-deazaguanine synthase QueE [Rhodoplanes sp. Z2-YC6860]AMN42232.1 7-cyano-7-deazaguanosine biosynthesis protein QueE [Rhodoplanes sp. Z2-YC6860]